MMPLVFVSHAAADRDIAGEFRKHLIQDFLGMCDVFVSSNLDSINAGQEWNNVIKTKLLTADIIVGLLSPLAVTRGWVYAEFGAGWIRGIPTIPMCHSGLEPGNLPAPLNGFQGLNLTDSVHLQHLYGLVSQAIGCQAPQIDFASRAKQYLDATTTIRQERNVLQWLRQLSVWNPDFLDKMTRGETDSDVMVPSHAEQAMFAFSADAAQLDVLSVRAHGMGMGTRVGASASIFEVDPGTNFPKYAAMM